MSVVALPVRIRADVVEIMPAAAHRAMTVPLMSSRMPCDTTGFASPAADYIEKALDFNDLLIENAPATFVGRAIGDSMIGIGIYPGDYVVINRARRVVDGSIVFAIVDGERTLKRFRTKGGRVWLQPENPAYKDIPITEGMSFEVWGVLVGVVRKF